MSSEVVEEEVEREDEIILESKNSEQVNRLLNEISDVASPRGISHASAVKVRDDYGLDGTRTDLYIDVVLQEEVEPEEYEESDLKIFQYNSFDGEVTETTGYLTADELLLREYYIDNTLPEFQVAEHDGRVELDPIEL